MRWAEEGTGFGIGVHVAILSISLNYRSSFLRHQVDRDNSVNLNHFDSP